MNSLLARFTFKKSSGQFVPPPPAPKPDGASEVQHCRKNAVTSSSAKTCPVPSLRGPGASNLTHNTSNCGSAVNSLGPSFSGSVVSTNSTVGMSRPLQSASSSSNNVMMSVSLSFASVMYWLS